MMNIDYIFTNYNTIFKFNRRNSIDLYDDDNVEIFNVMTESFNNIIINDYNDIDLIKKFNNLYYLDIQAKYNILPYLVKDNKFDLIKNLYNLLEDDDILKYSYQYTIFLIDNDLIKYISNDDITLINNNDYHFNINDYRYNKTFYYMRDNYNNYNHTEISHNFYDYDVIENINLDDNDIDYEQELELKSILYDKNNEITDIYENIFRYDYNIQYNKNMNMFKNNLNQKILIDMINNNDFDKLIKLLDNELFLLSFMKLLNDKHIYCLLDQIYNKDIFNKIFTKYFYYDNIDNINLNKFEFSIFMIVNKDKYNIDISNHIIINYIKSLKYHYYYDIIEFILQNITIDDDLNDKLFDMIINKTDLIYLNFVKFDKIDRSIIINKIDEYCENSLTDFIYYYTSNFVSKYKNECLTNNIYKYYKDYTTIHIRDILERDYIKLNDKINLGFNISRTELNNIIQNYYDDNNINNDFIKIVYNNLNSLDKDYFYDNFLNLCISHGDYDNFKILFNDKKRLLDDSVNILVNNINNMNHYYIFDLMLDNILKLS